MTTTTVLPNYPTTKTVVQRLEWNGATVRAILFDFKKAFDLIDHGLSVAKLHTYKLLHWVINCIVGFLTCRFSYMQKRV
jgi:hypothetical protein